MLGTRPLSLILLCAAALPAFAQSPRDVVAEAVKTELAASQNDHSHWLYFEIDRRPSKTVKQWVAQARTVSLNRVIELNGQPLPESQQRNDLNAFMRDSHAQMKQSKSGQHDDEQAAELLQMLPNAFIWNIQSDKGNEILLHFKPNPQFQPPDMEARVFAAMEGDMLVDRSQHRIVSLRGKLIRDVKIAYGLLGSLYAGGTFDVERRELSPGIWQITETHVHIQGHVLIFKNISENEDDVKSHFQQIATTTSLPQAEAALFHQSPDPAKDRASGSR